MARHAGDALVRGSLVVVPDRNIDLHSAEFEWRDNRVYLLEPDGSAVEGIVFVGEVAPD
jgi:hypothetical protein